MRESLYIDALGRTVSLRPGTSDAQVCADTFGGAGGYHVPPDAGRMLPRVVLDAGANIGLTAAHYKRIWPRAHVVGLEPAIDSYDLAVINAPDCIFHRVALTDWIGTGDYDPTVPAEAISIHRVDDGPVRCTTLGAWVHANGPIDFLKLDVEGSEWGILRQAPEWAGAVGAVLVELHDVTGAEFGAGLVGRDGPNPLIGGAVALLEAAGYEAVPHKKHPQAVWAWKGDE